MMPPPDGFEVCQRLKADPTLAHIPVLLVTALTDRASRLRGMGEGANDFLCKPLDTTDTVLRVRNAVRTKKLYDLSEKRYQRQVELEEIKESLVHMIVHDLKTPLAAVTGYARLVERSAGEKLSTDELGYLRRSISNGDRMADMIASVLDVTKMESGELGLRQETVNLEEILREVIETIEPLSRDGVELRIECSKEARCFCDGDLVRRVLVNLADNALRHLPMEGGRIKLTATQAAGGYDFSVQDTGRGIPEKALEKIFDKFGQAEGSQAHTWGLGLTFCKMAVTAHGGEISVQSQVGEGTLFRFHIPQDSF